MYAFKFLIQTYSVQRAISILINTWWGYIHILINSTWKFWFWEKLFNRVLKPSSELFQLKKKKSRTEVTFEEYGSRTGRESKGLKGMWRHRGISAITLKGPIGMKHGYDEHYCQWSHKDHLSWWVSTSLYTGLWPGSYAINLVIIHFIDTK